MQIAEQHLVRKQCEAHGVKEQELILPSAIIEKIISDYTRESGVRSLDKQIAKLARARAKHIAFEEAFAPELSAADLVKILGKPKFRNDEYEIAGMRGVVTGLARTAVGGDIL